MKKSYILPEGDSSYTIDDEDFNDVFQEGDILIELEKYNDSGHFWCSFHMGYQERDEKPCKRNQCGGYNSKNGRGFGICVFNRGSFKETGKQFKLTKGGLEEIK